MLQMIYIQIILFVFLNHLLGELKHQHKPFLFAG